ncbi:MAG: AAA family ATPase, partial [Chloroflexota bacterium]
MSTNAYVHRLHADCRCGVEHDPEDLNPQPSAPNLSVNSVPSRLIATYDYRDEMGALLYQSLRYEPKRFAFRRPRVVNPDPHNGDHWDYTLGDVRRVLYRLPELARSDPSADVYVPEGECDVDTLCKLGCVATCNPMGAGKWRTQYSECLRGRSTVILPDNDEPGQHHAETVAAALQGVAASVRVLRLPNLAVAGDVTNWVTAGGTAEKLQQLVDACPVWQSVPELPAHAERGKGSRPIVVRMSTIQAEEVGWLWPPYLALGKLSLLAGPPGVNKSWLSLAIATALSRGGYLPGVETVTPSATLLCIGEDGLEDTVRPRLDTMEANLDLIHVLTGIETEKGEDLLILTGEGIDVLASAIGETRPGLVVIDPLMAFLGGGVDIHRANEVRAVTRRLTDVADAYGCAIVGLTHLNKSQTGRPLYQVLGSVDFTAAARSVLLVDHDPNDHSSRVMVQVKSNLAATGAAQGFRLVHDRFEWLGAVDVDADTLLNGQGERSSRQGDAIQFVLGAAFPDGVPRPANDVKAAAESEGLAWKTVRAAYKQLGGKSRAVRAAGKPGVQNWMWDPIVNSG